jgi:hypothetical protein
VFSVCNRCWRTRGGGPNRLGNRPRGIPTETSRRRKASFTRVIDPTLQRIIFTTLLGRRHPQGSLQRTGPHTGLSPAEEPESTSNSYLARSFSVFLLQSARNDVLASSRKLFVILITFHYHFIFLYTGANTD